MITRILWATDFSQVAERALEWAMLFAKTFDASIIATHVAPDWVRYYEERGFVGWTEGELSQALATIQNVHISALTEQMNERVEQLRLLGFRVESALLLGSPAVQILEYAELVHADLIVLGSRGMRTLKEHLLGSTVARIIQGAQVPVMVVPAVAPAESEIRFKQILVPTDFSAATRAAIDYALCLAKAFGAQIHLLHVIELLESVGEREALQELERMISNGLKQWVKECMGDGYEIPIHVVRCHHAADGIALFVEHEGIDSIVMSTHGRTGLVRFLWGSVAERIIGQVGCPVIAAKAASFRKALSQLNHHPTNAHFKFDCYNCTRSAI
ncbi:MAG: universal stress protein [Armatimonadota bacterium]|nr:universal stress protein [Armatimonadota bacterium]MCX7776973.1 universal stress protein [Armatimonadota bacterium]MDW8024807.1 universal stress protein [Armatimonadota bacterium]